MAGGRIWLSLEGGSEESLDEMTPGLNFPSQLTELDLPSFKVLSVFKKIILDTLKMSDNIFCQEITLTFS